MTQLLRRDLSVSATHSAAQPPASQAKSLCTQDMLLLTNIRVIGRQNDPAANFPNFLNKRKTKVLFQTPNEKNCFYRDILFANGSYLDGTRRLSVWC